MKTLFKLVSMMILSTMLFACTGHGIPKSYYGRIMVLSVSSDGKYAISTDYSRHAVLWDIAHKSYKVLPVYPVNIYSAYFIKNSDRFIIQKDNNNEVLVEDVKGNLVKSFKVDFPSYGQVMTTDLKNYIAADEDFNVYRYESGQKTQMMKSVCANDKRGLIKASVIRACTDFISSLN